MKAELLQKFKITDEYLLTKDFTLDIIIPLLRNIEAWLSLVERCVRDAEVVGSNPVASTLGRGTPESLFYKASGVFLSRMIKSTTTITRETDPWKSF